MLVSVTLPTLNFPGWPGTEWDRTTHRSVRTLSYLAYKITVNILFFFIVKALGQTKIIYIH